LQACSYAFLNASIAKAIVTSGYFSAKLNAKMRTLNGPAAFARFWCSCKCTQLESVKLSRILPYVYMGANLLFQELRGQAELFERYVLKAELGGSLFAILALEHLVRRPGIETGARQ